MSKRQDIADALNTTGLVKAYPYKPSAPKTGDAWVQLGTSTRAGGVFEHPWYVVIALTQNNPGAADLWRDTNWVAIVNALEETDEGYVDEIIPVSLGPDSNPLLGLQFNFRSN